MSIVQTESYACALMAFQNIAISIAAPDDFTSDK
jgi:hypothetical protein